MNGWEAPSTPSAPASINIFLVLSGLCCRVRVADGPLGVLL